MFNIIIYCTTALSLFGHLALAVPASAGCRPFHTSFPAADVSNGGDTPFTAITPPDSYTTTPNGLELYLQKPAGPVTAHNGENDKLGSGATVNSTFFLRHGKTSFKVTAPTGNGYGGIVTAFILIGDDNHDEIDVELLSSDPSHWQTNAYAPAPQDKAPIYGAQSSKENIPRGSNGSSTISAPHTYTIDWNSERIIWSIDGKPVRTLSSESAVVKGVRHFPTHPMRLQLGIWDASSPSGTSEWAGGPIEWNHLPSKVKATIHSITVECP